MDAKKTRFGEADLGAVLDGIQKVVVAKGKKHVTFDLVRGEHDPGELAQAVLGPSGNLRAPAIRVGKKLLVGFSEEVYGDVFGQSAEPDPGAVDGGVR